MLTRLRRSDLNLITILIIVIIATLPFLTRPGLPRHTDLELHVFRAAEYGEVLRDGVLYPRWAPDFYYGYGYPLFNYYAPLTYLLSSVLDWLPGLDVVAGVKIVMVAAYALGAYGVYFLARRHFGPAAGVIASAAYVLSPYFLFIDPLMRGDLAEFFALGLLPWIFYVFDRPRRFSIAQPLVLAAFVFSHNLLALIGTALLALYLLWRGLFVDGIKRWAYDLVAIGLAAALTAVFWLPFIAERSAVRLDVAGPGHFDYHNHFIPLTMLLAQSPALDLGATSPRYIYNLGLVQWLLLIPAAGLSVWRRAAVARKIALFFVITSLLLMFLVSPASSFVWDLIPAAALIQFPWRLLGPAAFTLAMCAGWVIADGGQRVVEETDTPIPPLNLTARIAHYGARSVPAIILTVLLISALPTMYPPLWQADFGATSPRGMIDFELSGVALGTTSTGDFLPTTVGEVPLPAQSLVTSYSAGPVNKFDQTTLPPGATVQVEAHSADHDRFRVESPVEFTGRLLTFMFPGWSVIIDGAAVPIQPAAQSGLIEFAVPAGVHSIAATLSLTQAQLLATFISVGAWIALFVLMVGHRRPHPDAKTVSVPRVKFFAPLLIVSLVFLSGKIIVADRCDDCFRYTSPAGQVLGAQYRQSANFGGHIDLLGYDLPAVEIEAGQTLPLTLYWKATSSVPDNYQVFAHMTNPVTTLWGQSDKLNPGDFPTTRWPLDKHVWDEHRLTVLPGTPPGEYRLSVGLYTLADGRRVPVVDDTGQIVGDNLILETPVRVLAPRIPPPIEALQMEHALDRDYNGLRLLGWSIESPIVETPDFERLTLFWRAEADQTAQRTVRAELVDRAGNVAQMVETALPRLRRDEIRREQIGFWLPAEFPAGIYALRVKVLDETRQASDTFEVTSIEVKP